MANRSDDEMAHEFNAMDRPSDVQDTTQDEPLPPPAAAPQMADQHQQTTQMINELRVQMLDLLETQKAAVAVAAAAATASTSSAVAHTSSTSIEDGRYCWVCFATDEDDKMAAWVQPCKCSGTTKWVHQNCLQRWVDEKQKGNAFKRVNCPQCRTEYIIVFPEMGTFVSILEGIDSIIKRLSPFLAAGVIVGSLYWTAVTYGAVTVLQVFGHKNGLDMLERADPLVLLIGLPAIPAGLIIGRMICWEEMLLRFIQSRQNIARKFPILNVVLPTSSDETEENGASSQSGTPALSDSLSATRIFCGALFMPTVSAIVGRVFFESIQNNLHRTLIGGLSFIVVKGALKIYFKHKQHTRKKQRKILDFTDENLRRARNQQQQQQQQEPHQHSLNSDTNAAENSFQIE